MWNCSGRYEKPSVAEHCSRFNDTRWICWRSRNREERNSSTVKMGIDRDPSSRTADITEMQRRARTSTDSWCVSVRVHNISYTCDDWHACTALSTRLHYLWSSCCLVLGNTDQTVSYLMIFFIFTFKNNHQTIFFSFSPKNLYKHQISKKIIHATVLGTHLYFQIFLFDRFLLIEYCLFHNIWRFDFF